LGKGAACFFKLKQKNLNLNLPKELFEAAKLVSESRYKKAEPILRDYLKKDPLDVNAMKLLADIGIEFRAYKEAGYLLSRALDLFPDFHFARFSYANLLYKRQLPLESIEQLDQLLAIDPDNIQWLSLKAVNYALANNHEEALNLFKFIIKNFPANTQIYLSYGHTLRAIGKIKKAIDAYYKAISFNRGAGEAYWSLANLKTHKFTKDDIDNMEALLKDKNCPYDDYSHLLFAMGKAKEDAGDYRSSIAAYIKGNQVKSSRVPWDARGFSAECNELQDFFNRELFDDLQGVGSSIQDPIFILGLPRSGSTLIEQILASHSKVEGTTELQNIIALSRKIANKTTANDPSHYPGALREIKTEDFKKMGEAYISNTRSQRITSKPFFIDKMPNNFSHIGLIHLILPNAKIIDARRNPMDCCYSCYKQLFGSGQGFSYSFNRIGNYYLDYLRLMSHWDQTLPKKIHRVTYEDMVSNTESEIRKLLDYCGLEFEENCLNFYNNKRAVRTPSSEQVRQPIYDSGLKYWKNFEDELSPLKNIFIENGVSIE